MLETDSVLVSKEDIKLHFIVSFPSTSKGGGSFNCRQAKIMFEKELTQIARYSLVYSEYDDKSRQRLKEHIRVIEDRKYIHTFLSRNNGISFIPDNAVLPRMSGVDDRPLKSDTITVFKSPDSLAVEVELPDRRHIRGMMLKAGIIMITGGGFHGKSTLLQAIESGIYPPIPGDGRERVVTRFDAVTVRANEGRRIEKVNISPFIRNLPDKTDTRAFSTDNASGSTSQAAGIIESLETGSRLLLFDEDTCATNLLVRDHLIEQIISADHEPITPLYDVVRTMWEDCRISSLLVLGGLGNFMRKADTVLAMENFICRDATGQVRKHLGPIVSERNSFFQLPDPRVLAKENFDPVFINPRLDKKIACRIKPLRNEEKKLEYGMDLIDLSDIPHIVHPSQTMAIGLLILELKKRLTAKTDTPPAITQLIDDLYSELNKKGLFGLNHDYPGTLSYPRKFELAAAVNRMRSLKVAGKKDPCDYNLKSKHMDKKIAVLL
jgi:predicted ABC-class ATPase